MHRECTGGRETPKFWLIRLFDMLRVEALAAGAEWVDAGRLERADDVWFLDWNELVEAAEDPELELRQRVAARRSAHVRQQTLEPPRLITSDGEIPQVDLGCDVPDGSIIGMPLVAALAKAGVGPGVLVTYLVSLATLSIMRAPLEVGFYGWRLTLLRIAACLVIPFVAGGIARLLGPWMLRGAAGG